MKLTGRVVPISQLKARAAELLRDLQERQEPLVITQNGEARAVMIDITSFDQLQETLALLKILAIGRRQVEEGNLQPAFDALDGLRELG